MKDGKARAVVLVVHGYHMHSRYYVQFAKFLTNEGYAVVALDLPGHGRSGRISGIQGYVPDFSDYEVRKRGIGGWGGLACGSRVLAALLAD